MSTDTLEREARRRAGAKLGWYTHAGTYIAVNAVLAVLSAMSDRSWAIFPAFGWGLGLAVHGIVVFVVQGGGLHQRLLEQERARLVEQRDPW